ncbi:MAG: rluA [Proteobacteria bacterium]|nr:rluA [Pseudomonadota bacterium]
MQRTHSTTAPYLPPPDSGLSIIYQDDSLLVLNKPAGLLSVPGRGAEKADCLASRVQQRFTDALIVHRLDMETSGLIVMARGAAMHRQLSQLFEQRKVSKRYLAVVDGRLAPECGEVNLPLITDWPNRPRQIVDTAHGKPSQTYYQVLQYDALRDTSRVALSPVTGRSHQLRVHMQALGHPILGDALYAHQAAREKAPRLLLHAEYLSFPHPDHAQVCEFFAAPAF